jgi:predicted nucleic acid-binding Zn ribbon protein
MTNDNNTGAPSRLSDVLSAILKDRGWNRVVKQHRIFEEWDEAVGAMIAKNARPIRIDRGVIVAIVSSPVWNQELSLMKETIIGRLNERLGEPMILDIRFIQGEIPGDS